MIEPIGRRDAFLPLVLVLGCVLAVAHYFLIDDAFISFIYARHFAEGHGLVWYPDSNEFGYTNFLFTFILGCIIWLGADPLIAASLITIPSYLGAIVLLYVIVRRHANSTLAAYGAALSLAAHFTVSSYATSGLETSLHMLLILACYQAALANSVRQLASFAALALLCRLDSAVLIVPAFLYASYMKRHEMRSLVHLYALPLLLLAAFLLGCYLYYGAPLPNTFYAKMQQPRSFAPEGLIYLKTFLSANAYMPLVMWGLALVALLVARPAKHMLLALCCLLAPCVLWLGYIVHIGGDFMEFRLMVAVLPLFYAFVFISLALMKKRVAAILIAALANVWVGLLVAPNFFRTNLVGSIPVMHDQLVNPKHNWQMAGQALGALFHSGSADDVKLALHTTGAIPYYSRLFTVDIYGLNDRWVAKNGIPASNIAGHRKKAPFEYIKKQGVHVMIPSLPAYVCDEKGRAGLGFYNELPALLIPLATGCRVVAYYVNFHPRVEELIRNHSIERIDP